MNIIYIMGKSSSGKDTIFNIIKNKLVMPSSASSENRQQQDQ